MTRSRLILFDIDGTLVSTGGAGRRAMEQAFLEQFGVAGALETVEIAGRTDSRIIEDAMTRCGLVCDPPGLDRLRQTYVRHLTDELRTAHTRVLPGVAALLGRLASRDDTVLALLTGNYAASARLKLEACDLWRYFPFGAFGDDAADRNGLVPVALLRARDRGHEAIETRTVVVGDTRHDVACAAAGGVRCLAVATGGASPEELGAAGADRVLSDLSDVDAALAVIDELTGA